MIKAVIIDDESSVRADIKEKVDLHFKDEITIIGEADRRRRCLLYRGGSGKNPGDSCYTNSGSCRLAKLGKCGNSGGSFQCIPL